MRSLLLSAPLAVLLSCTSTPPSSRAFQIQSRSDLIGGRRALGEIGDYKLSNGLIHAIVQDIGHSRGFGVFGGSLIDVDMVRGHAPNDEQGPNGNDFFTEMFPAFFLGAIEPDTVTVLNDGSDGNAAKILVKGGGANFVSITKPFTAVVLPQIPMEYSVVYALEPGARYLTITTTLKNVDPSQTAGFPLDIPFGFITLLGEGERLFAPGPAGYNMRWQLPVDYTKPSSLEALPGEVVPMVLTDGDGVSYGLQADRINAGYLQNKINSATGKSYYPTAEPDSMLVPFVSGSFLATFWGHPPQTMAPGQSYSFTGYLSVGNGDIASAQKILQDRKQQTTGELSGWVREDTTNAKLDGITVVAQDDRGNYQSAAKTVSGGQFMMHVPPGNYRVYATDNIRKAVDTGADPSTFTNVVAGGQSSVSLTMERPAFLSVQITDSNGRPMPGKVSVEAIYDDGHGNDPPRDFLYNLYVGERYRPSNIDPVNRQYLEAMFFATNQGSGGTALRPGTYTVYASRGIEYDLQSQTVTLAAGKQTQLGFALNQVMPTPGYVSGDFHVHSQYSVDSNYLINDRIASYAAEGVDLVTSTDHNYISDFRPTVDALGLSDWLHAWTGMELTTLEMGHFNAYPIGIDPGSVTHGTLVPGGPVQHSWFDWFFRPPGYLFGQLHSLGKYSPEQTIVEVNHPRDSIMGYFQAFNLGGYNGGPLPPFGSFHLDASLQADGSPSPYAPENFSLDFDALEVFNGKRLDLVHNYRVPANPPPGMTPNVPVAPVGQVLLETCNTSGDCNPAGAMSPWSCQNQLCVLPPPGGGTQMLTQPVYPGALDDYYTLVGHGKALTAVGNSDSHSSAAEAGVPRTYLNVGASADGTMRGLDELAVISAIKNQQAIVTNGPFVEAWVIGDDGQEHPIGSHVIAATGQITIHVKVQAAPWVDVNQVVIKRGGADVQAEVPVLATLPVPATTEVLRLDTKVTANVPDSSFIAVEASGSKSMWPVFTPYEIPTILLTDAVYNIGAAFGYTNKYGKYQLQLIQQVTPFAFTNPIWVDRTMKQGLHRAGTKQVPLGQTASFRPKTLPNLFRLFGSLHGE